MNRKSLILLVLILLLLPGIVANTETFEEREHETDDHKQPMLKENETSSFDPESFNYHGNATAFTSPDSSKEAMMNFLDGVNSSLEVGVYQFNDVRIAEKIADLSNAGVSVRVLIEADPVQGMSDRGIASLNYISSEGGEVRTIDDHYEYYHPKYMRRDNSSVFLTSENLVASSFPSDPTYGNRGRGIILDHEKTGDYYGEVFDHDWSLGEDFTYDEVEYERYNLSSGNYSPTFNSTEIQGEFEVTPVIGPDTNMKNSTVLGEIRSAEESIYLQQYYIRDWDGEENPYLEAIKEAAKRGVRVKILLDSTWYHQGVGGNDEMVDELNDLAEDKSLDLEARSLSDYQGLIKSHNKGMIVDEDSVLVSTINWNENSMRRNRELGVIVENDKIADYYSNVFLNDWKDFIDPIADAGDEKTVMVEEEFILSAENSWDDHEIVEYRWDIDGDGSVDEKGEKITVHFEERGTYTVTLTVEDVGGNTDTDTIEVLVEEQDRFTLLEKVVNSIILISPTVLITLFLLREFWLNRS